MKPFKLEEFWKIHEFTAPYLLCCSDMESWSMQEIVAMSDPETRALWDNLNLGYTESPGHQLLRQEITNLYDIIQSDQVLTTAGAEEGIYCAMRALVEPGDHVIVIEPCYQSLKTLPEALGAEVTSVGFTFEEMKAAFRPSTKLLVLNIPHNPTGALLDKASYEGVIALARQSGAYIFSDEVYRFLEVDENDRLPSIAYSYEKGVSLNVMSKAFGLAGLRIGWLASRDANFLKKAASYKLYTSICNSAPSEILALIALRAKETILKRNRAIMLENLNDLDAFLARHNTLFAWKRPQGGTVGLIELLDRTPVDLFADKLVKEAGILIMPLSTYDYPGNFFRVGFGRKNMPDILKRFEEYLS